MSTALAQDYGAPGRPRSAGVSDNAYIKAISSDGAGGFHVTYVLGSVERSVHFVANDFAAGTSSTTYYKEDQDGSRYWLWSGTRAFHRSNRNMGSTEFAYFDVNGTVFADAGRDNDARYYFTYGVRTDGDSLPAGDARYGGRMYADVYPLDDPRLTARTRVWGDVRLTVDFGAGSVEGKIVRFRLREPGLDTVTLPASEYFDIADGEIVDGQFTASLTGKGTEASAWQGDVLGEFYGPAAEEVGGVLNATSNDSVMSGWFGGDAFDLAPQVFQGDVSAPLTVAVDRDFTTTSATEAPNATVTSVRSDGANGFNVTYMVDGQQETVHLREEDAGFFGLLGINYSVRQGEMAYTLDDAAGSLSGSPEFSHFNVNGWSVVDYASDGRTRSVKRGFLTYGVATDVGDLPTGTADYSGRVEGNTWDGPSFTTNRGSFTGDLSLTANFDAGSVGGSVTGIQYQAPGESAASPLGASFSFDSGTITGNGFSADLAGPDDGTGRYEGSADGQFFGPAAAEVGGVFQGTHTGNSTVLHGWFGGEKQ